MHRALRLRASSLLKGELSPFLSGNDRYSPALACMDKQLVNLLFVANNYDIHNFIFQTKDIKEITDEKILNEIHHLAMAFTAAQLEESPDSSPNRQDNQTVSFWIK